MSVRSRLRQILRPSSVGEKRRYNIATQDRWQGRAHTAVDMWLEQSAGKPTTVSDLGAGNELVGKLLRERTNGKVRYAAFDLHPQQGTTRTLDVREGLPPGRVDVVFALGLIEYLREDDPFLERLASYADHAVLSYVEYDAPRKSREDREALGWVRHQTSDEIETTLGLAGFEILRRESTDDRETSIRLLRAQRRV